MRNKNKPGRMPKGGRGVGVRGSEFGPFPNPEPRTPILKTQSR